MTKIEIETGYEIVRDIEHANIIQDEILANKKWFSVDSLLTLKTSELINEIRKLHIQKCKELEEKNENI